MNEIETHPFKAYVPPNAIVLIVGSFPGRDIIQKKLNNNDWFYGTKRNQFWKIISGVYEADLKNAIDKRELFNKKGIAVADIILKARRINLTNSDDDLEIVTYNDEAIRKILKSHTIERIFFTSMFTEKHFLKLFPGVKIVSRLPSPSPRYATMSLADKIEAYKKLLPK